jgi:multidrug efflux pump subunit AcrB
MTVTEITQVKERPADESGGPIAWMAKNNVAANLLMWVCIIGGLAGVLRVKQEVFPEFTLDRVVVAVPYPGASPAEVEQGILLVVEEQVRGIDGVKHVNSTAREGVGQVTIELLTGADPDKVLSDVKTAVDSITSFPEDAERHTVSLASRKREVVTLMLYGDVPLEALDAIAEDARSRAIAGGEVTQLEILGTPRREIVIEPRRSALEDLGMTTQQIALALSRSSLELPSGELETASGEMLVRVTERKLSVAEIGDVVVRTTPQGAMVRVRDIADITDGYADDDKSYFFNGKRAVRVTAYRVGDETPTGVAEAMRAVADDMREGLPPGVEITTWSDASRVLRQRIDLLVENAVLGLMLVLIILALFLNLRLAFWVSLGIPISFLGAFLIVPGFDASINMVTLFALIVTLGMVVDDAIIVGEHAFQKMQEGLAPLDAAIAGAREMITPVTFAVLSTVAAFSPLLLVPGTTGKIFFLIPVMVISILIISVVESFFVLPSHVAHMGSGVPKALAFVERAQKKVAAGLERFTQEMYLPALVAAIKHRYLTISIGFASFVVTIAAVASGIMPFDFFPELEGDVISATVRFPYGVNAEATEDAREELEAALDRALEDFVPAGQSADDIRLGVFTRLGESQSGGGPRVVIEGGSHLVSVSVELIESGERDFTAGEVAKAWRKQTPPLPGAQSMIFSAATGPGAGAAIDVQLSHADIDVLARASEEVNETLLGFPQLRNVENGYANGKPQLDFRLLDDANTLGITPQDLARQLRGAFFGAEALREQRGRDEVRVMVRLPQEERQSEYDLEDLHVRTGRGGSIPLGYVARFDRGRAATTIQREDGRRIVDVTASLNEGQKSPKPVIDALNAELLPQLRAKYPGLSAKLVGSQRRQADTFKSLGINFLLALIVIYGLIAIPFRSYLQPLVIIVSIPLGAVGAVIGHVFMGYGLSIISVLGMVALAGVVVNDSLVLIDAANGQRRDGQAARAAIMYAGARRLRPILLTSLTTFFGLLPMIFETSVQAQFLIPMAISLGFGVLFATLVALLYVPAVYMVIEDVRGGEKPVEDPVFASGAEGGPTTSAASGASPDL